MKLTGKVIKCSDNIDTDVIIPARYLNTSKEEELAAHCMEDLIANFSEIARGAILVAGKNFGCGSSREHAPAALRASGIICVIAEDFARIFYRNAINIGLPILECLEAVVYCSDGDTLELELSEGTIHNIMNGDIFHAVPFPGFIQEIISEGGLMNMARKCTEVEGI
ncbi:MAG: 3-isopropylmalate dehydratase small subunit [Clostridiales bacterium]|nr:3-isopropylmalate dehydratase small subunit [Clostridiales bacterium]